ncbi:hypothetical protein PYW08_009430 [Mythimna loreyi]|uniref:Uncharacterized protein n=1 Tax=Mythimna loreyi TaxID=667449 RepID=A0ACC2Q8R5_9NEOP|nr:hypothetical protein PYW08_009430 [Mythimna loreyi]
MSFKYRPRFTAIQKDRPNDGLIDLSFEPNRHFGVTDNTRHLTPFRPGRRVVYLALCQSLIQYCIVAWGGSTKTHMLKLERAQRALLKVGWRLPYRFPTAELYEKCMVLSVRKLFILNLVLIKHAQIPYEPEKFSSQRRKHTVCPSFRTQCRSSQRSFLFLGSHVYNQVNKILNIYHMRKSNCKKAITSWLLKLDYADIEKILTVSI